MNRLLSKGEKKNKNKDQSRWCAWCDQGIGRRILWLEERKRKKKKQMGLESQMKTDSKPRATSWRPLRSGQLCWPSPWEGIVLEELDKGITQIELCFMFCYSDVLLVINNYSYSRTKREMSGSYQNEEILRALSAICVGNSQDHK